MLSSADVEMLEHVGAVRIAHALGQADLDRLIAWSESYDLGRPGERIDDVRSLGWLLERGVVGELIRSVLGNLAQPVRALLFNKTAANNWVLGWHQDRTIAVQQRLEVTGFETWTVKAGVPHVEPPFDIIERMVTVRIHLDAVDESNAPLRIVPRSHLLGRIVEKDIDAVVGGSGELNCLASAGDVWLYRTAILHASKPAAGKAQRRVLQADYSADTLSGGLEWWAN